MFDFDKRLLMAAIIAVLISFGLGYQYGVYVQEKRCLQASLTNPVMQNPGTSEKDEPQRVYVYVVGEVASPGVLEMQEGDRIFQALEKARPGEDADLTMVNLAAPISDGDTIVVPKVGEEPTPTLSGSSVGYSGQATVSNGPLNINVATVEELDQRLPGIGPALAQRIVDYRQKNGGFKAIEELQEVSGIGEKRYEEIKYLVRVR
jgi:competence protein ComEA